MAKVKCIYCKQYFDRDKEPFVEVKPKRYAHANCAKNFNMLLSEDERFEITLEQYVEHLFKQNFVPPRVKQQIKTFTKSPYNYSYKGILRALKYWYEIKKGDIRKANGGISIVPSIYQEANDYYNTIALANLRNATIQQVQVVEEKIKIKVPERRPMKHRKVFSFLDEEEADDK